jgi:hypothetical protein
MLHFNQHTVQFEGIDNAGNNNRAQEQQEIKDIVSREIGGSSALEQNVRETNARRVFEESNPGLKYEGHSEALPFDPSDFSSTTEPKVLTGKAAKEYNLYSEQHGQSPYIGFNAAEANEQKKRLTGDLILLIVLLAFFLPMIIYLSRNTSNSKGRNTNP